MAQSGNWYEVYSGNVFCWTENKNLTTVPSKVVCGDGLSSEDDDFISSMSVPNPSLSEMLGADGRPLSEKPVAKPPEKIPDSKE